MNYDKAINNGKAKIKQKAIQTHKETNSISWWLLAPINTYRL